MSQNCIHPLTSTEVKQIGGRAGRYRSQFPVGEVSTLNMGDHWRMKELMKVAEKDIKVCSSYSADEGVCSDKGLTWDVW